MYLVVIAWLYVALMMSVAEATHPQGSLLGAFFTFVLYGVGPISLLIYLMNTPARKRALREREHKAWAQQRAAAQEAAGSGQPDGGDHAPADPVAPVRKES